MSDQPPLELILPDGFGERDECEAPFKGWLIAQVEVGLGVRYAVNFYDPVRLRQDLEAQARWGKPYLTEPGLMVLPEVTVDAAREAVRLAWEDGAFESWKPLPPSPEAEECP